MDFIFVCVLKGVGGKMVRAILVQSPSLVPYVGTYQYVCICLYICVVAFVRVVWVFPVKCSYVLMSLRVYVCMFVYVFVPKEFPSSQIPPELDYSLSRSGG